MYKVFKSNPGNLLIDQLSFQSNHPYDTALEDLSKQGPVKNPMIKQLSMSCKLCDGVHTICIVTVCVLLINRITLINWFFK